ncbi:MAG: hypothetical protein ACREQW_24970 [Candidatus Binatia bacterium]
MIDVTAAAEKKVTASTESYAPSLRAIGQALEALQLNSFDMEARHKEYLVWDRRRHDPEGEPSAEGIRTREPFARWLGFVGLWRKKDSVSSGESQPLRYTPDDIDRLDQEGRTRRRNSDATPDAYRLSQLLRAVGGYVHHGGGRLLGVSWREQWIGVVYEKGGQRQLEVLRPALVYDFWVRMYLMRTATTH